MGIFDRFPYSSTHEMNLDFMLGKATEIAEDMQTVTAGMAQVQDGLSAISEKTEQATQAAAQAAQSASSIEGSVTAAEEAAEEAQMHNESAQTWANNALTYKADCQRAATEAAASSSSAAQAATAAAASEDTVAQYAQAANASAQSAANNNDSAHQYANQASASASNATFHSSNAQTAATNAQTAATNANTSATNASASADRAASLKTDVETLHRMCTAAVDQAATEAVNAANSAAQAAATKTDVENLVESLPEDFTDLNNTVNQLSDEIDGLDAVVNGTTTAIPFVQTGNGYIVKNTKQFSYTPGATGDNQAMVINDLEGAGLAVGDYIRVTVGITTGGEASVGFNTSAIAGTTSLNSVLTYSSETPVVQTFVAKIPTDTESIVICNRLPNYSTPTIEKYNTLSTPIIISDIEQEIEKNSNAINNLETIRYCSCVKKPFNFSGKRLDFFGDSITYGYIADSGSTPSHQAENQYPKTFSVAVGAEFYNNAGVSGSCIYGDASYNIANKVIAANLSSYDYVFIAGGVNDWHTGVTEAQLESAMESMCSHLASTYTGDVIFITPINEAGKQPNVTPTQTLQNVRNVITRIALKYGFSVVQGWEFPFPTSNNDAEYISLMFQDKLHPTELGYAMYAQALRNALC